MMRVIRCTVDLHESALEAHARAVTEQNKADVYYLAMMTDVEIEPEEERHEQSL